MDRVRNNNTEPDEALQSRLKKLANVHAQLLNHALKSYPSLERLVYSTCSANHEENEAVVDEALSVNGKFKLLDCTKMLKGWMNKGAPGYDCSEMCLNAVPNDDCTNGFFIAVFVRRDFDEKDLVTETDEIDGTSEVDDEDIDVINNSSIKINKNVTKKKKKNKKNLTAKVSEDDSNDNKSSVNVDENKKDVIIKSEPVKMSKNAKRRVRRLKLNLANGLTIINKKSKKSRTKETVINELESDELSQTMKSKKIKTEEVVDDIKKKKKVKTETTVKVKKSKKNKLEVA